MQAEELAQACEAVSYAAKPLLAFYSLSQAGRAIAAAHLPRKAELSGHGLTFDLKDMNAVLEATVTPPNDAGIRGAFQDVSTATQSPPLGGRAELGALWAANPDLANVSTGSANLNWPGCLTGFLDLRDMSPETIVGVLDWISVQVCVPGNTSQEVVNELKNYPSLAGLVPLAAEGANVYQLSPDETVTRHIGPDDVGRVMLGRPAKPGQYAVVDYWKMQNSCFSIVEKRGWYDAGFAQPSIADAMAPSPLMLWWALLLGLSSLARYYPAQWTRVINLDESSLAVPLQRVLDIAAARVPARVLAALEGEA
jgi:hypothetical protein